MWDNTAYRTSFANLGVVRCFYQKPKRTTGFSSRLCSALPPRLAASRTHRLGMWAALQRRFNDQNRPGCARELLARGLKVLPIDGQTSSVTWCHRHPRHHPLHHPLHHLLRHPFATASHTATLTATLAATLTASLTATLTAAATGAA